ncbi:MAG: GNAT family N-acetyltransferase [Rhizobiales bacterium]|nr:GNAT family N-acetyltransferase [Hyphomicrobiales bacterium]
MSDVSLRVLSGLGEFLAAEALQRTVWGEGDKEDPADLMMVIQSEGGLVAGAFSGDELVGYVFGFPARETHVQHSHRLAVHPKARGAGLAVRLKFFQRSWCLSHGITLVRWTFDPLRHANAHLNMARLGARASTYYTDYYGAMQGINAGLPSDRLLAEWHLQDAHVDGLARGDTPSATGLERLTIPRDLDQLLKDDPSLALSERLRVRNALQAQFAAGREIRGYDPVACCYLLGEKSVR